MNSLKFLVLFIVLLIILLVVQWKFGIIQKISPQEIIEPSNIIIIGIDGAGWNVIDNLLEKGVLPNIQAMMKEGSYGTLKTIKPTKSAVIWTSIATGKSMLKHGVVDWYYLKKNNIRVPFRQSERRAKAFWNIFGDLGYSVGIINWFITFPPEEVNGYMVSEEFRHISEHDYPDTAICYPRTLQKKLSMFKRTKKDYLEIIKNENLPNFRKYAKNVSNNSLIKFYHNYVVQDKIVELASLYLIERWPTEVYATYFRLIDVVSHFAAGLIDQSLLQRAEKETQESELSPETIKKIDKSFSEVLEPIYAYSDRIIGRILNKVNPNSLILIISDHGFVFERGGYGHTNTTKIPHGIILVKGPCIRKNYKIKDAHIYDLLPTLLYSFDLPVAKDMDGKVLTEIFTDRFLKKKKIRYIESYESDDVRNIKSKKRNEKLDKKYLEELKALGYIK